MDTEKVVCSRSTSSIPQFTELMFSSGHNLPQPHRSRMMHAEIYTDGVDEITVGGSIVRVDLVSLSPTERDPNNVPKKVFRQRLIFSIEAFANSVEVMQTALQGRVEAGLVNRPQARTSADTPPAGQAAERSSAATPNP